MMKKLLLVSTFVFLFGISFSQVKSVKSDSNKVYHNEFGLDVSGFLDRYIPFGQNEYSLPSYYLTYRRHFERGNIRGGIGGDFERRILRNSNNSFDSNKYHNTDGVLMVRFGWEFEKNLSKKWEVYYGLDLKYNIDYQKNFYFSMSNDYVSTVKSNYQSFGLSPLLGFRFRLTNRLSLTTEANFTIYYSEYKESRSYKPQSSNYPEKPDYVYPTSKRLFSNFTQPLSVILTFDI